MRLDRSALRAACDAAIADHRARHDREAARWAAYLVEHRDAWLARYAQEWAAFADALAEKLDAGDVIADRDLPRDHRRYGIATYSEPHGGVTLDDGTKLRDPGTYAAPMTLHTLRRALDVITDDEVTHTGLAALGVTGPVLRDALGYIGRADT